MMKTAHRSSGSGLPLTKNMPFASNSVPSRSQPRNMTGIYLGLEGNIKPPQKTNVPPLARGRGTSVKTRTPSEHKRYKLVEKMRIKEEKRGFVGQTIKTSRRTLSASGTENLEKKRVTISSEFPENFKEELIPYPKPKSWGPAKYADRSEFFDLIRTNPRNYTVVVNNGVTRSENLSGPMSFPHGHEEVSWQDLLAEEVHRMSMKEIDETSGLEECYKKICKGNVNSLYSLLPHRNKMNRDGPQYTTGFTVKSYNNLNRAEILADFSSANARPRTVPLNRPIVPSPYFFKYYNTNSYHSKYPPISSAKSARSRVTNGQVIDNPFSVMNDNRIFGLPGSGAVTRSLRSRNSAWTESDLRLHAKLHGSPQDNTGDDTGMKDVVVSGRQVQVPALGESATATAQETQRSEVTAAPVTEPPGQPVITIETESVDPKQLDSFSKGRSQSAEGVRNSDMETVQMSNQEMSFVLGVADEHGKEGEVEIDEADVNPEEQDVVKEPPLRGNVRKASITEKVEKSRVSAAYIESIKENAEQRKKNLEKMLDEHAEIVQEISRVASSDNISAEDRDQ